MASDWNLVKRLFHECVELPPAERTAYLDDACAGDDALRRDVLGLLAADEQPDGPMRAVDVTGSTARPAVAQDARRNRPGGALQLVCPICSGRFSSGELVCPVDGEVLVEDPESLVGTTIDDLYHVERFLSRGGFGVVYLARHVLLRDLVAIKVLPRQLTSEPERLERFLREGRVARSLQHPNLVKVYDLRATPGGLTYMVQEYVDGWTLREEIERRGKLTPAEVVELISPVAAALDEAHQHGVVHRDIKPENIMISGTGTKRSVKLLDLGIAKLRELLIEPNAAAVNVTQPGHYIGTPHYMSPEQWGDAPSDGGPDIDPRADVYSLGVLVYELVSGAPPFYGRSPSAIRRGHLAVVPRPLVDLDPTVPEAFSHAVSRALEKARARRQSGAGVFVDELRYGLEAATLNLPAADRAAPSRRRISWRFVAAAIVLAGVAAGAAWLALRDSGHPPVPTSVKRVTFTGNAVDAAISPDGSQIVASVDEQGKQSLYLCQVDGSGKTRIGPLSDAELSEITFSNNGMFVYFCSTSKVGLTTLYRLPMPGGSTPQPIVSDVGSGVAMSPDDTQIAFIRQRATGEHADLVVANADGTGERPLATTVAPQNFAAETPSWSPDGRTIACSVSDSSNGYRGGIAAVTVSDSSYRLITPLTWWYVDRVAWLPDGKSLVASVARNPLGDLELWRIQYPSGKAARVTTDLNSYDGVTSARDGALAAVQTTMNQALWVAHATDGSDARPFTSGNDRFLGVSVTPDERVLYASRRSGEYKIYLSSADGQRTTQLTFDRGVDRDPVMTPDMRTVFFVSNRSGAFNVWRVAADGQGAPTQVTHGVDDEYPAVSPDGQWLVYQGQTSQNMAASIWKMRIDGSEPERVSDSFANWPAISPDGRWIVYTQQTTADEHVKGAIVPVAGTAPPQSFEVPILTIPRRHYQRLRWSADSRDLLYIADTYGVSQIWSLTIANDTRRALTSFPSERIFTFDTRGGVLALVRGTVTSDVVVVTGDFPPSPLGP